MCMEFLLDLLKNFQKSDKSVMIHQRNWQIFPSEIFKTKNRLKRKIVKKMSAEPAYHLQSKIHLERHNFKSARYGTERNSRLRSKI